MTPGTGMMKSQVAPRLFHWHRTWRGLPKPTRLEQPCAILLDSFATAQDRAHIHHETEHQGHKDISTLLSLPVKTTAYWFNLQHFTHRHGCKIRHRGKKPQWMEVSGPQRPGFRDGQA